MGVQDMAKDEKIEIYKIEAKKEEDLKLEKIKDVTRLQGIVEDMRNDNRLLRDRNQSLSESNREGVRFKDQVKQLEKDLQSYQDQEDFEQKYNDLVTELTVANTKVGTWEKSYDKLLDRLDNL